MRTLVLQGRVRKHKGESSSEMIIPGRDELIVAPPDWPMRLAPGTLTVDVNVDRTGPEADQNREALQRIDAGGFTPVLVIPQRKIVGNPVKPDPAHPTRGFAQVWRSEFEITATGRVKPCWMLRIIGTEASPQIELVADEKLGDSPGLCDGALVKVTAWEEESESEFLTPSKTIEEWCEAAEKIEEAFGAEKAMGYLIGEKFLNALEAAESRDDWREAIPLLVARIKTLFEPWQLAVFLNTPRRLGALGHTADDEAHRMLRASLDESEKATEDARTLLLLEWAKDLLLGETEEYKGPEESD